MFDRSLDLFTKLLRISILIFIICHHDDRRRIESKVNDVCQKWDGDKTEKTITVATVYSIARELHHAG